MALFNVEKKGMRCEPAENGVQKCKIFKATKDGKVTSGTEFGYVLDENCDAHLTGNVDIMEEDEEKVAQTLKNASAACRRGIYSA